VLERLYGVPPVFYRDGSTIPALAYFQSILGLSTTGFGFGLGDHIHAPNERTPVRQYHTGRVAWLEMLALIGRALPPGGGRGGGGGAAAAAAGSSGSTAEL
jgi:acetylornithine deacetylase/succinyl-diaminopimelate desuccinylase-like protein